MICSSPLLTNCKTGRFYKARPVHNGVLRTTFRLPLLDIYAFMSLRTCCVLCICTAVGCLGLYSICFPCVPCMLHCDICNCTGPLKGRFGIFNKTFEFKPSGDFSCYWLFLHYFGSHVLKIMTAMHLQFNMPFNGVGWGFWPCSIKHTLEYCFVSLYTGVMRVIYILKAIVWSL